MGRRRVVGRLPMNGVIRLRQSGRPHSVKTKYNRAKFRLEDYEPEPSQTCEICGEPADRLAMLDNGWLACIDCRTKYE